MTTSSLSLSGGAAAASAKLGEAQSAIVSAASATKDTVASVASSALSAAQNAPGVVKDAASAVAQAPGAVLGVAASAVSTVGGAATGALSAAGGVASSALSVAGGAVPKILVGLDHVADLVPFGGTAVNILDLGIKHFVVKDMDPESSAFKDYIAHIQKKETSQCLLYSVPFVGTVAKIGSVALSYFSAKPEAPREGALPPYDDGLSYGGARLDERLLDGYPQEGGLELHRDPLELVAGGSGQSATVNPYVFPADNAQRL